MKARTPRRQPHSTPPMRSGFTITEVLVVIAVIAILATISFVSYNGIQNRAYQAALITDLKNAASTVSIKNVRSGQFPDSFTPGDDNDLDVSPETQLHYLQTAEGKSFCITATSQRSGVKPYMATADKLTPHEGTCPGYAYAGAPPTADSCFAYDILSTGVSIYYYYNHEGNNSSNPACPKDIVIPRQIGGKDVVRISLSAFENRGLTSVVLPSTVTEIAPWAFSNNSISSVVLPESLSRIELRAFQNNRITSIKIPNSVTHLGNAAFINNRISSVSLPETLSVIPEHLFSNNRLSTVAIPPSIAFIHARAFMNNSLTSVSVPAATSVHEDAFDSGVTVTRY